MAYAGRHILSVTFDTCCSTGSAAKLVWLKQSDAPMSQLDKAEGCETAEGAVHVLAAGSDEACKGSLR